jgi:hypothetical protein
MEYPHGFPSRFRAPGATRLGHSQLFAVDPATAEEQANS